MPDQKRAIFIARLANRTANGSVRWEATSEENYFQAAFSNYVVLLFARPSERFPDTDDVVVQINDDTGRKLEAFSDEDFEGQVWGGKSIQNVMIELYREVRNKALGLDKAVDELLEELGEEEYPF